MEHWALRLLCVAACLCGLGARPLQRAQGAATRRGGGGGEEEEVNVLMFGMIQLSESLAHVYDTTGSKMARIEESMRSRDGALQWLLADMELAGENESHIKEALGQLTAQMAGLQAQTRMTQDRLAGAEREETELKAKVRELEAYLHQARPASVQELKERAEEHSDILRSLQYLTQTQKEILEAQDQLLSKLQNTYLKREDRRRLRSSW